MMKKAIRVTSLLLCAVLVLCMLPAGQASAAGYEASGLTWGTSIMHNDDGTVSTTTLPGAAFFYGTPNVLYYVEYYMVGQDEYPIADSYVITEADGRASDSFFTIMDMENGSYYFVVTPVANDFETPVGNSMTSAPWYYTKPTAKCSAPSNTYWSWPVANFTSAAVGSEVSGVEVEYLFAKNANETPEVYGWTWVYANYTVNSMEIFDDLVEYAGAGYYYFRVRTLSTDITRYNHSDWSALIGAYHCGTGFMDVDMSMYYAQPVLWAVNKGITTGMDTTHFAPDGICNRAQIVTFLWRANGCPEPKSSNNPFTDVPADAWYADAVLWAVDKGITTGTSTTTFSPDEPCTRGQVATFLWRAQGEPSASGANSFNDVTAGAYYYDAVMWAVDKGITNGMGGGRFVPDDPCTRGQIVTFLHRAMG